MNTPSPNFMKRDPGRGSAYLSFLKKRCRDFFFFCLLLGVEIDPGYTPEILLEGAADTAEILSCMVNGSEAEYEWKENKICLKAESLSEGYNRITVKVRGADGIVRTMKPWEVNVKPKTSTLVSQRTSQKPKGTRLLQSLRRLWNLIRAIAEIQNQTTRYLRALCRK